MAGKDTLRENALRKVKAKERATKETMSGVLEISEQDTSTSFKPELCPLAFQKIASSGILQGHAHAMSC